MDRERDELDRLIDGALASYADAEPLAGLEQRVVNRVRGVRKRRRWLVCGVGAAVAASVVVGIVMWSGQKTVVKKAAVMVARVEPAVAPRETAVVSAPKARVRVKRVARTRVLPKLEQFPTPTPMTAEERGLVVLVRRDPQGMQAWGELEARASEPVEIRPIRITPLPGDRGE